MANRLALEGAGQGEAVKERRDPGRREAGQGQLRQSTAMGHLRLHKRRMRQARSEADEDEQRGCCSNGRLLWRGPGPAEWHDWTATERGEERNLSGKRERRGGLARGRVAQQRRCGHGETSRWHSVVARPATATDRLAPVSGEKEEAAVDVAPTKKDSKAPHRRLCGDARRVAMLDGEQQRLRLDSASVCGDMVEQRGSTRRLDEADTASRQ
jgi:hypothetical protein